MKPSRPWVVCRTCQAGYPLSVAGAVEFLLRHMLAYEERHEVAWVPEREAWLVVSKQHFVGVRAA